jgi:MFS family permease
MRILYFITIYDEFMTPIERRTVSTLALIYALRMFGLFMVLPVLVIFANDYEGATATLIGVAIGAYGLTQALLQLPFGMWSDRIGRKPVILIGLTIFTLGSALAASADSIWMLIAGRALQGAGAVASTLMALMTDLTREESRTKAMASIGASIGLSFTLAMVIGPVLADWLGLSGLFALTALFSVAAMGLLVVAVPTPKQQVRSRDSRAFFHQLGDVVKDGQILRLSFGIFTLHAILVGCFVSLPVMLLNAGLEQSGHWQIYLPVMLVSFICMVPFIIVGEKHQKMKPILFIAVVLLGISLIIIALSSLSLYGLVLGLWLFFVAFNILEASLPSLISKFAPAGFKGSAMGLYSTSQFLGAFVGGVAGGFLSEHVSLAGVFWGMIPLVVIWAVVVLTMAKPRHLSNYMAKIANTSEAESDLLESKLLTIPGVYEVVIMLKENTAYLKVDNKTFDPAQLQIYK